MASFSESKPKHRQVFDYLREGILAGSFKPGERLPSETALVRRFGASRPTVAKAFAELRSAGLVVRRAGSGSYVQAPETVRNRLIGLLIPGLGNTEIFEPICAEIARQAQAHQFILLWGNSSIDDREPENAAEQLCRQYIQAGVAGVFFAPLELTPGMDAVNRRIVAALQAAGVATVLLDRDLEPYPGRSNYDVVGIDNRLAGYAITRHLLDLGRRHIEFVCRPLSAPTVAARVTGWREALADRGIRPGKAWLRQGNLSGLDFVRALVRSHSAEAFVCANDITAGHLMRGLLTLGIRIPKDVAVVAIDDVKYAKLLSVPLTTLHQPCLEIGAAAVDAMVERMANPRMPARQVLLNCRLVVRESCGSPRRR